MLNMYQDLTGDAASPNDEISKEIKAKIQLMLEIQDPDIIIDMRKTCNQKNIFDIFWNEMENYFNEVCILFIQVIFLNYKQFILSHLLYL